MIQIYSYIDTNHLLYQILCKSYKLILLSSTSKCDSANLPYWQYTTVLPIGKKTLKTCGSNGKKFEPATKPVTAMASGAASGKYHICTRLGHQISLCVWDFFNYHTNTHISILFSPLLSCVCCSMPHWSQFSPNSHQTSCTTSVNVATHSLNGLHLPFCPKDWEDIVWAGATIVALHFSVTSYLEVEEWWYYYCMVV